jgi:hypothetical protein
MRFACWMSKTTNTHLWYVILTAFRLQQWLHEHASMLRCTYFACLDLLLSWLLKDFFYFFFILNSSGSSPSTSFRFRSWPSQLVHPASRSLPFQSLIQHSLGILNAFFRGWSRQLLAPTPKLEDQVYCLLKFSQNLFAMSGPSSV